MSKQIEEILAYNKQFVEQKEYEKYATTKYPDKKIALLSCMDTRLTELLPAALGLRNGDVKMIKNAGAMITHPFGSVMRSLLVGVYSLKVEEIMVVGHYHCGMQNLLADDLLHKMEERGIQKETIEMLRYCGVDIKNWLKGFDSAEDSVKETVKLIANHPLLPEDVDVTGFLIDPSTGRLDKLCMKSVGRGTK